MIKKYFGTDGIRGRVGVAPISVDWVLKLGWAFGRVLARAGHGKVVIGKDTRVSGYMFESALEAGLAAAGMDIYLLGPMPTPAIAYLTRTLQADAGIVISASHNPYYDNGIKFFTKEGNKICDAIEQAIEQELTKPIYTVDSSDLGKASRIDDAQGRYIEFCKSHFPINKFNLKKLKIVVDCANGATYAVAPHVFAELGAEVITVATNPDGFNINTNCGSTHPEMCINKVLSCNADLGICLDGDGDRVLLVDHQGNTVDGDQILFILAKHYKEQGKLKGGVVGTDMSNLSLENSLKKLSIPFCRTKVGDRFVQAKLQENNWELGGEPSGHILCLDAHNTGDGIIAVLKVLSVMCNTGKSLLELTSDLEKYPQILLNVAVDLELTKQQKKEVILDLTIQDKINKYTKLLGSQGRILIRPSGTEPLIRVMVEGKDYKQIKKIAEDLAECLSVEVNRSQSYI